MFQGKPDTPQGLGRRDVNPTRRVAPSPDTHADDGHGVRVDAVARGPRLKLVEGLRSAGRRTSQPLACFAPPSSVLSALPEHLGMSFPRLAVGAQPPDVRVDPSTPGVAEPRFRGGQFAPKRPRALVESDEFSGREFIAEPTPQMGDPSFVGSTE